MDSTSLTGLQTALKKTFDNTIVLNIIIIIKHCMRGFYRCSSFKTVKSINLTFQMCFLLQQYWKVPELRFMLIRSISRKRFGGGLCTHCRWTKTANITLVWKRLGAIQCLTSFFFFRVFSGADRFSSASRESKRVTSGRPVPFQKFLSRVLSEESGVNPTRYFPYSSV